MHPAITTRAARTVVALACVSLLAAVFAGPADAAGRSGAAPDRSARQAAAALHAAQRALSARPVIGGAHRDATLVLARLVSMRSKLSPADRRAADALLARPTDGSGDPYGDGYTVAQAPPVCGPHVCIHYVTSTADAVPSADTAPANGIPDFVDQALAETEHVHQTYVAAGYKSPKSDGTKGGNGKVDVYLADVGAKFLYGYCTSDQRTNRRDVWAYCVLDNDFRVGQFPVHTPLENLQVTAAHEYFHAVQFAYDIGEDRWFMEATATWAEDEVYTDVNDNRAYLRYGQLGQPRQSLDWFHKANHYGNWIFFRYLTERLPSAQGGVPTLVRAMWRLADASPKKPNLSSIAAIKKVLAQHQVNFSSAYAMFAARNRFARQMYAEGAETPPYPQASIASSATLTPSATKTATLSGKMAHLTSYAVAVSPSGLSGGWKVTIKVDMADKVHTPVAVVDRIDPAGAHHFAMISLNKSGVGSKTVGFDDTVASKVVITLVNAGTRYTCNKRKPYACGGVSQDDASAFKIYAVASH